MRIYDLYKLESTDLRIFRYHCAVGIRFVVSSTFIAASITLMRFILGSVSDDAMTAGEKPSDLVIFLQSAEYVTRYAIAVLVVLGIMFGLYNFWRAFVFYKQLPENIRKDNQ